jgi:hypothetical protein
MTPLKANTIISSILLLILLMLPYEAMAQRRRVRELKGPVVYSPPKNDSLRVDTLKNDTLKANVLKADTLSAESVKKKKQPLDAPVVYSANDSIVFTQGGFAHLYGDGKVNYENIELYQTADWNKASNTDHYRLHHDNIPRIARNLESHSMKSAG